MGTIFGRPISLYLAAVTASLNVIVILGVVTLSGDQVAALNVLAAAIFGLLAGSDRIQLANGAAAASRKP
jgi:hypothetical protein